VIFRDIRGSYLVFAPKARSGGLGLCVTSFSVCRYNVALAKGPVYPICYIQAQTGVCVKVNNYELSGRRLGVAREPTYALPQARTT
jgi:hypothetical protein